MNSNFIFITIFLKEKQENTQTHKAELKIEDPKYVEHNNEFGFENKSENIRKSMRIIDLQFVIFKLRPRSCLMKFNK